jgi:hypothetical protein
VLQSLSQREGTFALEADRPGFDVAKIRNLFLDLYLHLKAGDFRDLPRLIDVLKLHGFLPFFDAH